MGRSCGRLGARPNPSIQSTLNPPEATNPGPVRSTLSLPFILDPVLIIISYASYIVTPTFVIASQFHHEYMEGGAIGESLSTRVEREPR